MSGNMIGRVFNNRYQITERIGIGGMAEVYRAQDRVLGRMVAVKVMLPQYAADSEFTKRFRQEAAASANLSSPYIVNVYDWGQDEGTYYIVMEYVRGSDLKTAIKQRGAINQRKVAEIGAQVCQALSVAHNQDIIHRDIKPQNIMVQPDGNVKVMDFGIARAKNTMSGQTSAVLGTAHYISPEQAQGKELTSSSDIYSLGIVLYEAACGQLPFDGPDSVSVATKQVQEFPLPPTQINPNLDPALEAIIMRALEKDPRNRFATVGEMKHALNDFLAGRNVNLGATAGTALLPNAGNGHNSAPLPYDNSTTVMPSLEHPENKSYGGSYGEPRYEEESGSKSKTAAIIAAILAILALLALAGWFMLNGGLGSSASSSATSSQEASSSSVETVDVPNVQNLSADEAKARLEEAGLVVGEIEEVYDTEVESGKVIRTEPSVGAGVEKGSRIKLFVSKGIEQITVPDISLKNASQARQLLEDAGLKPVESDSEYSETIELGLVIRQDPAALTTVDAGSSVTYVLSKGTDKIEVQDVYGRSEADAATTLRNQGFNVEIYHSNSSDYERGTVMAMNPNPGTKLNKGDTVSITICDGATQYSVTAEIYADPATAAATVALDTYLVDDGGSVGYYITVPENYSIASVTDGAYDYGTANTGQIVDIHQNTTLVITLAYTAPEPQVSPQTDTSTSTSGTGDVSTGTTGTTTDTTTQQVTQ